MNSRKRSRGLYFFTLWSWASVPIFVMMLLSFEIRLEPLFWRILAIVWAFSFAVLFFVMTSHAMSLQEGSRAAVLQFVLGVVCTVSLSLPAVLLGAMPLISDSIASFFQNYTGEYSLPLPSVDQRRSDGRVTKYVIAIDVSDSFLNSSATRRSEIQSVVRKLFAERGVVGSSLSASDTLEIRVFAGGSVSRGNSRSHASGNVAGRNELLGRLYAQGWSDQVAEGSLNSAHTDLLGALRGIQEDLECPSGELVRIVLFSDLEHDVRKLPNPRGRDVLRNEFEAVARKFYESSCEVSLVAFTVARTLKGQVEKDQEFLDSQTISGVFAKWLARSDVRWQEIPLLDYAQSSDEGFNLAKPLALYRNLERIGTLCLKSDFMDDSGQASKISVPEIGAYNMVVAGLYDLDDSSLVLNVRDKAGSSAVLSKERPFWLWARPGNAEELLVEAQDGVGEDFDGRLIAVVPSESLVYFIDLEVSSMKKAYFIRTFHYVLTILNFIPLILAYFVTRPSRVSPNEGSATIPLLRA